MFEQMLKTEIKFGTDGWRALIARDFTFSNVAVVAQAYSDFLKERGDSERGVIISYDTRFLSAEFAGEMAEVISSNRIPVLLSNSVTPTPVLSHAVKSNNAAGGIMITASHNPYRYNGIKFKDWYGGPALNETTLRIASHLHRQDPVRNSGNIEEYLNKTDLFPAYEAAIKKYVRFDLISMLRGRIAIDVMHGAGVGVPQRFFGKSDIEIDLLHDRADPRFGGLSPEPILKNLAELAGKLDSEKYLAGFAMDGDADRFAVLDAGGRFVELHDLMPLLAEYLIQSRNLKGRVIRTTSMADTVDRLGKKRDFPVEEVPVGFKNVTEKMLQGDVILGGEESGGFGYQNFIPERDGLLSILLVLEMMAVRKKDLKEMVADLRSEYGPFVYDRIDRHFDLAILQKNLNKLIKNTPKTVAGYKVNAVNLVDGLKIYFEEGAWMLMRVSQTEPLARIYAGGPDREMINRLLIAGEEHLTGSGK